VRLVRQASLLLGQAPWELLRQALLLFNPIECSQKKMMAKAVPCVLKKELQF